MNKRYRGIQNDIYDVLRKAGVGMTPNSIAEELTRVGDVKQVTDGLYNLYKKGLVYKKDSLYFCRIVQIPSEDQAEPQDSAPTFPTEIPSIIEDIAFIIQDYQKLLVEHKRLKEDFDALHRQYCNIQSSMNGVKKLQAALGRR